MRQLRREVATLTNERDEARRNVERVTAQRDELRRVIGNVRSYARQEAQAVVENHAHLPPDLAATVKPDRVAMRPTVHLAAHLSDPEPVEHAGPFCYHPAEDTSVESFRHRCHGNHEPCSQVHDPR